VKRAILIERYLRHSRDGGPDRGAPGELDFLRAQRGIPENVGKDAWDR
jgi:hypothetical protein